MWCWRRSPLGWRPMPRRDVVTRLIEFTPILGSASSSPSIFSASLGARRSVRATWPCMTTAMPSYAETCLFRGHRLAILLPERKNAHLLTPTRTSLAHSSPSWRGPTPCFGLSCPRDRDRWARQRFSTVRSPAPQRTFRLKLLMCPSQLRRIPVAFSVTMGRRRCSARSDEGGVNTRSGS
jgi:hypothetical protein